MAMPVVAQPILPMVCPEEPRGTPDHRESVCRYFGTFSETALYPLEFPVDRYWELTQPVFVPPYRILLQEPEVLKIRTWLLLFRYPLLAYDVPGPVRTFSVLLTRTVAAVEERGLM